MATAAPQEMHIAMALVALADPAPYDAIYEPFSGSGTTIIAGEMEARRVYAMELHPPYVDVAVQRWEEFTGKTAVLEGDVRSFAEIKAERVTDG